MEHEHIHSDAVHDHHERTVYLRYTVAHNASHAQELADLGRELKDGGDHEACEHVEAALELYRRATEELAAALECMEEH